MRLTKHHRPSAFGFNMTPMIDIVFLLIIFFMTVSQITQANNQQLQLPSVGKVWADQTSVRVSISVLEDGQVRLDGKPSDRVSLMKHVDSAIKAAGDPQRLVVLVRCDHRSPSRFANELLMELGRAGIVQVRFSVTE